MNRKVLRICQMTLVMSTVLIGGRWLYFDDSTKDAGEFGGAVEASGSCGWECCRPLAVRLHAAPIAGTDPDPTNDPNVVDLVIQRINSLDTSVPLDFRILYCPAGTGCNSGNEYWVTGAVDVFGDISYDNVPYATGACGFDFGGFTPPSGYVPSPLTYEFGTSRENWDITPCMNDSVIHADDFPPCFADTDYGFFIARTLMGPLPNAQSMCFSQIQFRIGSSVDDPSYFVQHDYDMTPVDPNDPNSPVVGPCPLNTYPDQYLLGANGWLTLTKDDLTREFPGGPLKTCHPPGVDSAGNIDWPGGQVSDSHCVIAVFGDEWE
jgi:hypothetical protein